MLIRYEFEIGASTEYLFNLPQDHDLRAKWDPLTTGFDKFAGGWNFKELGPDKTRVLFSYNITTKPGLLSWLLTPVVVFFFKRETRKRITAL